MVANGAPVVAARLLGTRWSMPVDGGLRLADGNPLFGASKTWRGLVAALLLTPLASVLLGYSPWLGAVVGLGAMAGDLLSSFLKRRMGIAPSGRALGLDQVPEALIPALLAVPMLDLDLGALLLAVALFAVLERLLSRILYRLHIRRRPY